MAPVSAGRLVASFVFAHLHFGVSRTNRNAPTWAVVLLEQIRTIDKKRLKWHMGIMPAEVMARVDKALAISIGIPQRNPS